MRDVTVWFSLNWKFILFTILVLYLSFQGLGNNNFWDDEANTAVFAKNLLKTGRLDAWDGNNLIAYKNGAELNDELVNIWMPPLQYYIEAFSFWLFGISNFTARFPFVIIGLASVWVLYKLLKELIGRESKVPFYAALVMGLNVSFLLYIRQARYYSLTLLFPLVILFSFYRYIRTKENKYLMPLLLSSVLLFYSNYIIAAAFLETLLVVYIFFHFKKKDLLKLIILAALFLILTVPYIYFNNPFSKGIEHFGLGSWEQDKLFLIEWNLVILNNFNWFPWIPLLGIAILGWKFGLREKKAWIEWGIFTGLFILFLTLYLPVPGVRYLVPLMPFGFALTGLFLVLIEKWGKYGKYLVFVFVILVIFTNVLALHIFNTNIKSDFLGYVNEIHNDYTTPYDAVIEYLSVNAKLDDVVFSLPHYTNQVTIHYLGDRLRVRCVIDNSTNISLKKVNELDPTLLLESCVPDWIITYCFNKNLDGLFEHLKLKGIEYKEVTVLDTFCEDMTRPEVEWHSFGPIEIENVIHQGIHVYFRKDRLIL